MNKVIKLIALKARAFSADQILVPGNLYQDIRGGAYGSPWLIGIIIHINMDPMESRNDINTDLLHK